MDDTEAADLEPAPSAHWLTPDPGPASAGAPPLPVDPAPRRPASAWTLIALIAGIAGPVLALVASVGVVFALAASPDRSGLPLLVSILMATGLLGIPLAWEAWRRMQGGTSPAWQSQWGWLAVSGGLIVALLIIGQASVSLSLVPELVLAVVQPLIFITAGLATLTLAAGGWPGLSRLRVWAHLVSGAWVSVVLAFAAEVLLVGGLAAVVLIVILVVAPEQAREIMGLVQSMDQLNPEALLEFALQPWAVILAFVVVSFLIPLLEELLKPVGVILLLGRRPKPMEAFVGGVLGGIGFAITETLSNLIAINEPWFVLVLARIGTLAMHGLTAGIVGWGWGQLAAGRVLRFLLAFAGAVLLHGVWNGCVVVMVFAGLILGETPDPGPQTILLGALAGSAVLVLITLVPLSAAGLALIGYRLRSTAQQHPHHKAGQGQHPPPAPGLVDQAV